jgi:hypothetical protein
MSILDRVFIHFALASTASLGIASASLAAPPPDGTETTTLFCGELDQVDPILNAYGIASGDPFLGTVTLTQRPPDVPGAITSWNCTSPGLECGEMELEIPGFVPPQTAPSPVKIFGPVSTISQSIVSYNLVATIDGFVADATGTAELNILCPGCPTTNDRYDISPTFMAPTGDLLINLQVPGIGSSAGTPAQLSGAIVRIGGLCRNHLPSSSPWGLMVLAGLMVAAAVVFAGGRLVRGGG